VRRENGTVETKDEGMEGRCERHQFDRAIDRCGRCGGEFCHTCVVYPFGAKKAPYCLPCAVEAAGVRSGAGHSRPISRRERKRLDRERESAMVAATPAVAEPEPFDMDWFSTGTGHSH
jgi:hypothetical protein